MTKDISKRNSAFTLIELLIVIAIIAILSIVVVLTLSPQEMLRQARDQNRLSDMDTLTHALSLYQTDKATQGGTLSLGNASTVYISLPDPSLSGNTTSTCASLGLPLLPTGYLYQCSSPQSYRDSDGTGWIPINLASTTTGNPLSALPKDPQNTSSSRLYYTYTTNGSQYELTTSLESQKYKLGGTNDVVSQDGGTLATVYEKGSKLGLEPLDYGDPNLVGYWTFDEGSGSTAYDYSGSNANGTWSGTPGYAAGKVGSSAGSFDGSTEYVQVNSSTGNFGTSNFSLSAWINASAISGTYEIVGKRIYPPGFDWYINASTTGLQVNDSIANGYTLGNYSYIGTWHHVVVVVQRTTNQAFDYTDGVLQGAPTSLLSSTGGINNGGWLGIGADQADVSHKFSGFIDDVRIYNRALSASEVAALYAGGK